VKTQYCAKIVWSNIIIKLLVKIMKILDLIEVKIVVMMINIA